MCELIEKPELKDRQFDFAHSAELKKILADAFRQKTQAEWLELIGKDEFCVTPVRTLLEALDSDLTTEQCDMLLTKEEDFGNYTYVKPAVKLSETAGTISRRAPYLGEHTDEVLAGLGYTTEEIAAMRAKGEI